MAELAGKVALVTGGATGIGLGAARALAAEGAALVLFGPDVGALERAAADLVAIGATVRTVQGDVASGPSVAGLVDTIECAFGRLDIIVNSAAIQPYGTVETMAEADWDRVLAVNLKGIYLTGHYGIPLMRAGGGGAIVNVASVQGIACQTNVAAYVASKGAALALTRAMALDHAKHGIRVNAVCPGSIDTPMLRFAASENLGPGETEDDVIAKWGAAHPIGRVGTTDDVGAMIAFLAGPRAAFCTGGEYKVDGGLLAKIGVVLPD
ncbi:SDR family oxidoreductase [Kaistia dalseonensis]|uniref:NAD(P)-dependent dehydrogenase (Short-subunit alcohol dehydrogenase family) n=1 Tax=Kaistia dalseonensis TaxID=410840 RepID=A0ABU0HA90_9HYPH|nr:SDR family oxidoreductase [Kaistia dalseonensis]MCX5496612.1 SDR family oxidoreductase [Kaistia dalseonensis]MDQ0439235.1 NAD(P)-dependent dehydrogenase (short-subunit alcohol dehydrogenase family) [Kaistia dalseonensis]